MHGYEDHLDRYGGLQAITASYAPSTKIGLHRYAAALIFYAGAPLTAAVALLLAG